MKLNRAIKTEFNKPGNVYEKKVLAPVSIIKFLKKNIPSTHPITHRMIKKLTPKPKSYVTFLLKG